MLAAVHLDEFAQARTTLARLVHARAAQRPLYPTKLREPEYADGIEVQRVRRDGSITHRGFTILLTPLLREEPIGIAPRDDGMSTQSRNVGSSAK